MKAGTYSAGLEQNTLLRQEAGRMQYRSLITLCLAAAPGSLWLSLALSGSLWLSLALSGSLWLSLTLPLSLSSCSSESRVGNGDMFVQLRVRRKGKFCMISPF